MRLGEPIKHIPTIEERLIGGDLRRLKIIREEAGDLAWAKAVGQTVTCLTINFGKGPYERIEARVALRVLGPSLEEIKEDVRLGREFTAGCMVALQTTGALTPKPGNGR